MKRRYFSGTQNYRDTQTETNRQTDDRQKERNARKD